MTNILLLIVVDPMDFLLEFDIDDVEILSHTIVEDCNHQVVVRRKVQHVKHLVEAKFLEDAKDK